MSRGIPHVVMKNGEFLRVEDLDTVCEQLKSIFDNQAAENSRLHENLQAITDKKWKDEELKKLKKKREDAKKAYTEYRKKVYKNVKLSE